MRFEREDAKLGLLILLAFAIFGALAFRHTLRLLFHPETIHAVHLANAADLSVGAEVQLLGLRVGEVRKIEMLKEAASYRFVATFGLRSDAVLWRGTKGVVTPRMVGGPFLDLQLPPVDQRLVPLAAGDPIEGEQGASAGTLVTELTALTRNLNETVTALRVEMKAHGILPLLEQPEVRHVLHEFAKSLTTFREASKTAQETLAHGDRTLETADRNMASLERSLTALQAILERRGPDLDAAIAQLGPALAQVQRAGADLSELLKGAGPEAGESLRALHRTLASLQELIELLKAKPNRIVFGTPTAKEQEAARKRAREAEAATSSPPPSSTSP